MPDAAIHVVLSWSMEKSVLRIGRRNITVSNLDKVLYPGGRVTKARVIEYYSEIAPVLLPHFKNRPVTLVRFPDGVFKESFYEKNAPGFTPEWVKTFPVPRSEGGMINYILINDLATLVWAANLAALELHPFLHRVPKIDCPTHIVFDLDPGEGADVLTCIRVALLLRELLEGLKLRAFPKVSGSKGLQMYVPLNTPARYETTQAFARAVADLLTRQHPKLVVAQMSKALRAGKVFIDWSQNVQTKTTVGVYSLRAKHPQPFVSVPVAWDELIRALEKREAESLLFSPEAALARVKKLGDLFAPVLTLKQRLPERFVELLPRVADSKPLAEYAAKRDFSSTHEPAAALPQRSAQGSRRRFVVQNHAAGHLHYDFRLEMHNVLKSWAVPKGVPLQNGERHSAFETEDHPIEYLEFEGIIPKGEYGGGTVMVWDIGSYDLVGGNFYAGHMTVFLTGKKLKGEWTLQRLDRNGDNREKPVWLLIKTGAPARRIPAARRDLSALTGRNMEQISRQADAVWESNHATASGKPGERAVSSKRSIPKRIAAAPVFVPPMKATLVEALPEGPEWSYEVKWDGYRALAAKHGEAVRLLSLKNKNLAGEFPAVVSALRELSAGTALLDGEIVAVDAQGHPSFQALQNRASLGKDWYVVYYAFDLLSLEGEDLRDKPLEVRRRELKILTESSEVRFSSELKGSAGKLIKTVKRVGLEGIVAKRRDSVYASRARTLDWRKLKLAMAQEFVIGGFKPEGDTFSSLLVGYYENGKLMFAGKVRQGLNPPSRQALMKSFARLRTKRCPFTNLPSSKTGHFGEGIIAQEMTGLKWVRPTQVAQVSFTEWTHYGLLRHATYQGLRDDKEAKEVLKECPQRSLSQ